jgi:hypothetical protein
MSVTPMQLQLLESLQSLDFLLLSSKTLLLAVFQALTLMMKTMTIMLLWTALKCLLLLI